MRKTRLIKMSEELYIYIKKSGERRFGKGLSMPMYLYKITKRFNNDR